MKTKTKQPRELVYVDGYPAWITAECYEGDHHRCYNENCQCEDCEHEGLEA